MQNKVMIGVPSMGYIKDRTVSSLFKAAAVISCPAKLTIHTMCYVHVARNSMAKQAIESGATHLMFIDSDMDFEPGAIERLLNLDKDVIGGLYYRRQVPYLPTINNLENDKIVIPKKFPTDAPFKVWAVATGFMLIKTSVLKKIEPPWFGFMKYKGGQEIGEDLYFCRKVNEKGFEVWCDPTIDLGHIGDYRYDRKDYDAYQDIRPKTNVVDEFDGIMK